MAVINGTVGSDPNLVGTDDGDQINGLGGDDRINAGKRPTAPGSGTDQVDGGDGSDTLIVNASSETQGVQVGVGGPATIDVRSTSGNFYVDAHNMERLEFTGGSGDDSVSSHSFGGRIQGGLGIDLWSSYFAESFANIVFALGTTTSIAPLGLVSIGGIERIAMTTGAGNDRITGGAFGDTIITGDGNDIIDARGRTNISGSTDFVDGGDGVDRLIASAVGESSSVQLSTNGSSVFWRSTSGNYYVDAHNIEQVFVTGGGGNDSLETGNRGGRVDGGGGIDTWTANFSALTGNIVFHLGTTTSIAPAGISAIARIERIVISTGSGNDTVTGGVQGDTIFTGAGDDIINAGSRQSSSIDHVDAGAGNDLLKVSAASDTLGLQLSANGSSMFLRSISGNFYVDAHSIEMINFVGGSGNDSIQTLDRQGTVDGGGGIDFWHADFSHLTANIAFALGTTTAIAPAGITSIQRIDRVLFVSGGGNDMLTGGVHGDTIYGMNGNDTINARTRDTVGGAPTDLVWGGGGTDTLIVGAAGEADSVSMSFSVPGSFFVRSTSNNFYIDAHEMEMVRFVSGAGNDTAQGGFGNDVINTNGGNDTLLGGGGNDSLNGGADNDAITGGRGLDTLNGGAGNDRFIYTSVLDSRSAAALSDSIVGFVAGEDEIDLTQIDADNNSLNGNQAFTFINAAAFSGVAGELRSIAGQLQGDVNGDSVADLVIRFTNNIVVASDDVLL